MVDTYIAGQDLALISVKSWRRRAANQDSPKGGPSARADCGGRKKNSSRLKKQVSARFRICGELDEGRAAVAETAREGSSEWSKRVDMVKGKEQLRSK